MPVRDIIVIGASAGGVEALSELARGLPADLPAAVFVVLHCSPHLPSHLPEILSRRGILPARHAEHGEPIRPGRVYVAPPDYHLIVRPGVVELSRGPRENRTRPAIDPTFRSAARSYGDRVAGVVLSGTLGDGTVGLMAIKARGGMTIVQDPADALHGDMPLSAIQQASPRYVMKIGEMPPLLARLASDPLSGTGGEAMATEFEHAPEVIRGDLQEQGDNRKQGETTTFACPECGGTLWQFNEGHVTQFRCHVGHIYSPESFLVELTEDLEAALWRCVRMFTEKATIARQLAASARSRGQDEMARRFEEQADAENGNMRLIRESLLEVAPGRRAAAVADRQVAGDGDTPR